jgi:hypothetical protein
MALKDGKHRRNVSTTNEDHKHKSSFIEGTLAIRIDIWDGNPNFLDDGAKVDFGPQKSCL